MKLQILIFLLLVILILSICLIIFASINQISGGKGRSSKKSGGKGRSSKKSGGKGRSSKKSGGKGGGSNIEELEGLVHLILEEYSKKIEQLKKLKQNNELNRDKIKELNGDLKELEKYLQWLDTKYKLAIGQIRYDNFVGKVIISSIDDVLSGRIRQSHEDSDDKEGVLDSDDKEGVLDDYDEEIVFGDEGGIITFEDNGHINTEHNEDIDHIDTEHNLMNNEDFKSKIIEITDKHKGKEESEYDREKIKSEIGNIISIEDIHNKIQEFHNKWKGKEEINLDNLDELGEEDDIHTKIQKYHEELKEKQENAEEGQNILNLSPLGSKYFTT